MIEVLDEEQPSLREIQSDGLVIISTNLELLDTLDENMQIEVIGESEADEKFKGTVLGLKALLREDQTTLKDAETIEETKTKIPLKELTLYTSGKTSWTIREVEEEK